MDGRLPSPPTAQLEAPAPASPRGASGPSGDSGRHRPGVGARCRSGSTACAHTADRRGRLQPSEPH